METLIQDCQLVSNVSVLCQDGLVNTHKIVLAGISDFIKNILAEIPVGDQATIFMPNFRAEDLEKFILLSMNNSNTDQNVDISRAFGIHGPKQESNVKVEIEDTNDMETHNFEVEEDNIINEDVIVNDEEGNSGGTEVSENIVKLKIKKKKSSYGVELERCTNSARMLMSIEDFQEKIRLMEEKIMSSPKTEKARLKNKKIRTNIQFQKALSDIVHKGLCVKEASEKYNVPRTTLGSLLRSGNFNWKGRGSKSKTFTSEEEERICKIALERSDGGNNLDVKLLKEVITEEIATILFLEPDREFKELTDNFVWSMGDRHDLFKRKKVIVKHGQKSPGNYLENFKRYIELARMSVTVEDFQEKVRLLEAQIIDSPKTEKDRHKNAKTRNSMNVQKALLDIVYNGLSTVQAARKFNVPRSTLNLLIKSGKFEWRGRGKRSQIFTDEEEKRICQAALERSNDGLDMSFRLLKQVISEEISILKNNEPDREFILTERFTRSLGDRHNLFSRARELRYDKREGYQFECDVCFKNYSLKNSLVYHKRTVHFPFLN